MQNNPLSHLKITPCIIKGMPFWAFPSQQARLFSVNYLIVLSSQGHKASHWGCEPLPIFSILPTTSLQIPKFPLPHSNLRRTDKAPPIKAVYTIKFNQRMCEGAVMATRMHYDPSGMAGKGGCSTAQLSPTHLASSACLASVLCLPLVLFFFPKLSCQSALAGLAIGNTGWKEVEAGEFLLFLLWTTSPNSHLRWSRQDSDLKQAIPACETVPWAEFHLC